MDDFDTSHIHMETIWRRYQISDLWTDRIYVHIWLVTKEDKYYLKMTISN